MGDDGQVSEYLTSSAQSCCSWALSLSKAPLIPGMAVIVPKAAAADRAYGLTAVSFWRSASWARSSETPASGGALLPTRGGPLRWRSGSDLLAAQRHMGSSSLSLRWQTKGCPALGRRPARDGGSGLTSTGSGGPTLINSGQGELHHPRAHHCGKEMWPPRSQVWCHCRVPGLDPRCRH